MRKFKDGEKIIYGKGFLRSGIAHHYKRGSDTLVRVKQPGSDHLETWHQDLLKQSFVRQK